MVDGEVAGAVLARARAARPRRAAPRPLQAGLAPLGCVALGQEPVLVYHWGGAVCVRVSKVARRACRQSAR